MWTVNTLFRMGGCSTQGSMRLFCHAAAHLLFGTHVIQNEEQTKINAHTSDEAAVFVDLLCFMKAYEAQIRLKFVLPWRSVSTKDCLFESISAL